MRIAVAGGAGSIGSALVDRLIGLGHEVCVFDIDEYGLYKLAVQHGEAIKLICGDVSQPKDLIPLQNWQPEVVYNCAAIKHITFCEDNPALASRINTSGAAYLLGIRCRHILLSTDKAVEPSSVLGITKQDAEWWSRDAGQTVVRLCNVWDTRGSFFETAAAQAAAGKAITITDPGVTRWYIGKESAVDVLIAAMAEPAGSVIIPTEPAVRLVNIYDEIQRAIRQLGQWADVQQAFVVVGLREGEKLHESMMWPDEEPVRTGNGYCCVTRRESPARSAQPPAPPAGAARRD